MLMSSGPRVRLFLAGWRSFDFVRDFSFVFWAVFGFVVALPPETESESESEAESEPEPEGEAVFT